MDLLDWIAAASPPPERKETPRPAQTVAEGKDAPTDDVERAIAKMWEDLLGVNPVGVNDDFFELGGHSLTAVRLVAKLEKAFKVKLPLGTLFEARTIS